MAITVNTTDTFEQWRVKTNQLGSDVDSNIAAVRADLSSNVSTLNTSIVGNVTTLNTSIVGNVNNILANINSTSGNIVTGNIVVSGNISAGNIRITDASVTANLTVTANANIASNISILGNAVVRNNLFVTSGNIGLGTSAPSAKLDIMAGSLEEVASFDSTGNAYISLNQNGTNTAVIRSDNFLGSGSSIVIDNNTFNTHATANAFVFRTLNAGGGALINRVTITQAGRLGVGLGIPSSTFHVFGNSIVSSNLLVQGNVFVPSGNIGIGTSSPAEKLHVYGPGNIYNLIESSGATGVAAATAYKTANRRWEVGQSPGIGNNNFTIYDATASAVRVSISTTGNFGIGTDAPSNKLHVSSGATDEVARFEGTGSPYISLYNSGVREFFIQTTGGGINVYGETNKPMLFYTNTFARMAIAASGQVGIGTTSPSANLHVVGNAIVSSNLTVSGNVIATGYSSTSLDAVGSVIVALYVPGTHPGTNSRPLSIGDTIAGSTLRYNFTPNGGNGNDFGGNRTRTDNTTYDGGGSSLSGTWRCMGRPSYTFYTDEVSNFYTWHTGLFVRVM